MNNSSLVPRNKSDFERLNALIAAGPEAAAPILDELLPWLQDMNWPIAAPLADFLVSVGAPLLPHLKKILSSHDEMWTYWILLSIIEELSPQLVRELAADLEALAAVAENGLHALRIGITARVWDDKTLRRLVANRLSTYEEFVGELKAIQLSLPSE